MPKVNEIIQTKNFKKNKIRPWDTSFSDKDSHRNSRPISIASLDPNSIILWKFKDRKYIDEECIASLSEDIKINGQQQPCIVRRVIDKNTYELIIGERRWRAAKLAKVNLEVLIKDLNDNESAIAQSVENANRIDLTDYEKWCSYTRLIENKILSRADLVDKLGKSKQYISALLSFSKIPKEINNSISDMRNVSAYTAEKIKQLSQKGDNFIYAIIKLSKEIREGKIGHTTIEKRVLSTISDKNSSNNSEKPFYFKNGKLAAKSFIKNKSYYIKFSPLLTNIIESNKDEVGHFIKELITYYKKEESG